MPNGGAERNDTEKKLVLLSSQFACVFSGEYHNIINLASNHRSFNFIQPSCQTAPLTNASAVHETDIGTPKMSEETKTKTKTGKKAWNERRPGTNGKRDRTAELRSIAFFLFFCCSALRCGSQNFARFSVFLCRSFCACNKLAATATLFAI